MTISTYGTNVPSGLFLPGMIIGCCVGQLYALFLNDIGFLDDSELASGRKALCIIGVGAVMAGYTRMTYSMAVIVMETSHVIDLFFPSMISVFVSGHVGYLFTRGLYERAVRGKQMPILIEKVPNQCKHEIAEAIMGKDPVCVSSVESLKNLQKVLQTSHHAFPVLNKNENVVGLIPRNFIIVLLLKQHFYNRSASVVRDETLDNDKDVSVKIMQEELTSVVNPLQRTSTYVEYSKFQDASEFPSTPSHLNLSWEHFTRDALSLDL